MTETTPSPLGNVTSIDDERIKNHLDRVVRGTVEETLNDPPPMKWSDLRYVFDIKEDCNGPEALQA